MSTSQPEEFSQAVVVYVTASCGYCMMAKSLLRRRGIEFATIDVTGDAAARRWLATTTGQRTVPQIFVRGRAIGGFQELAALDARGELFELVGEGSSTSGS